jgi:hypothetical protein
VSGLASGLAWQRCYKLCSNLIEAGTELPTAPGQMTLQDEDLGAWVQAFTCPRRMSRSGRQRPARKPTSGRRA